MGAAWVLRGGEQGEAIGRLWACCTQLGQSKKIHWAGRKSKPVRVGLQAERIGAGGNTDKKKVAVEIAQSSGLLSEEKAVGPAERTRCD